MESSIAERPRQAASRSGSKTFVRDEFRKAKIPGMDYQTWGISSCDLWPGYPTVMRIIPGFSRATGEIFRQNINCDTFAEDTDYGQYLSDTFYKATTMCGVGRDPGPGAVQYEGRRDYLITDYPPGSPDAERWKGLTVMHVFCRDILYAQNTQTKYKKRLPAHDDIWGKWVKMNGVLPFDKPSLLMQALVYEKNGRQNTDLDKVPLVDAENNPLPVLTVVAVDNKATIENMLRAFVEPRDPLLNHLDALTNNRYGGFAEADGIMLYMNPKVTDKGKSLVPAVSPAGAGWTPEPLPLDPDFIRSVWHPWGELLNYMTAEEQLYDLAERFGADTVNYVIGTCDKLKGLEIPQDIAAAGLGRYVGDEAAGAPTEQITVAGKAAPKPAAPGRMPFAKGASNPPPPPPPPASRPKFSGGIDLGRLQAELANAKAAQHKAPAAPELDPSELAGSLLEADPVDMDIPEQ